MNLDNEILSEITVFSKYAKYVPELGRRETWEELVIRNRDMHIEKYPQLKEEIIRVYSEFVIPKKILPSMRSLQFGGRPIELANNRIYNCAYLPADSQECFSELMFLLLGGTGAGYSVQARHVYQLPKVIGPSERNRRFVVGDSIEGWADAVKVLVRAYFEGKSNPIFDTSDIRPKGTRLITSGGKAPGPQPLEMCLHKLRDCLDNALGRQLYPIEVHDMMCHIADAVLAGGIRRAALICLFDRDDDQLLQCKSSFKVLEWKHIYKDSGVDEYGEPIKDVMQVHLDAMGNKTYDLDITYIEDGCEAVQGVYERVPEFILDMLKSTHSVPWYIVQPQRGRANNSAVLPRGEVTEEEFRSIMKRVEESGAGEPGVYWTNDLDWGTNPSMAA